MQPVSPTSKGFALASWIDRHRWSIIAWSIVLALGGGYLASGLRIKSDFAALLPPDVPSVRNLRTLEKRARAFGSIYVVVETADQAARKRAASELFQRFRQLDSELVINARMDNGELTSFMWDHRFLYASLEDLQKARSALADKIKRKKLEANPLYVDFDDEKPKAEPESKDLEKLRARLDKAEKEAKEPTPWVSGDKTLQVLAIRATFAPSKMRPGRRLLALVRRDVAAVQKLMGPDVRIGMTGDVVTIALEQKSILRGLLLAAGLTFILVMVLLLVFFRSPLAVAAHLLSLGVGVAVTFGMTRLAIGHLNMATAFLGAIVVGNGINTGLILLSRHFEEVRRGDDFVAALGRTLVGASRGTLAAALTAGIAYISLIVTDFRGFRHFGIIAGSGMVLCWITAFTVLPAGLCILHRHGRIKTVREPALGRMLAALYPRRVTALLGLCAVLAVVSVVVTARYVASDPLETDWRKLRSSNTQIAAARRLNAEMTARVEHSPHRGNSGRFAIGLPDAVSAGQLATRLRRDDEARAPAKRLFDSVIAYHDLLPKNQTAKIKLLGQILDLTEQIDVKDLDAAERRRLEQITPAENIDPLGPMSLPDSLAWAFIERDGTRGRLVFATLNPDRFDMWNVDDLVSASSEVRALDIPAAAVVGGQAFVFSDMVQSMERDGPLASIVAFFGAMIAVVLLMGLSRYAAVTIICMISGTLGMITLASLMSIKVNFLDFVAVPITIGIGIDYAVNMAARARQEVCDARRLLATTGGAVLLCSLTTIIGYGSLLLSDNAGIRSFGLAAILGEFTCLFAALVLVPVVLCRGSAAKA